MELFTTQQDRILLSDPQFKTKPMGDSTPEGQTTQPSRTGLTLLARLVGTVAVAAVLAFTPLRAKAAPSNGVVTAGDANIATGATNTIVTQSSDRAVIAWDSFNLAANESVDFIVPAATSATLNRINDSRPSLISGTITSNGVVYFTNPNGLVFDATSRVTANGFFAATQAIASSQFMAGGVTPATLTNLGRAELKIDGTITAPAITAMGGTVTVTGSLDSPRGTVLVSSTNLTTIGAAAVISVDAAQNGDAGRAIIWSDNHTDYFGFISAQGGSDSGDGGFVEVSGKLTLNYNGLVNTLAPHGKTGTLLLDPTDITISATDPGGATQIGSASAISGTTTISTSNNPSWLTPTLIVNQLASSNVIINANMGTGTGSGLITVASDITSSAGNNLTLTGGQIVINAKITINGSLSLTATRASVWQDPNTIITAYSISGSAVGGFTLNGANKITEVLTITNSGSGGISVKNAQALSVVSSITLDGGTGGVSILAPGYDVTLWGGMTVKGSFLRLDVGGRNNLKRFLGTETITATGMDVFFSGATTGNDATLNLGTGNFIYVTDNRSTTGATTIDNRTALPAAFAIAGSGLTVTTTGTTNGQGVVYGGTVEIQGVGSAGQVANGANNLRYIEGTGISVTNSASAFSGSLVLVSSGAGLSSNVGIDIRQNLSAANNLTLIQSGSVTGNGISASSSTLTATNGALTLIQSGSAAVHGIVASTATLTAGGDLSLIQSGTVGSANSGIYLDTRATFTAGVNSFVNFKTNNQNLSLNFADNFAVTSGRVRIDLGTGTMTSAGAAAPSGGFTLNALGLDVFYTGATAAGNSAKIDVGSGSFTFVNDKRSVTTAVTLTNTTTASTATNGWGAAPTYGGAQNARTLGGLTINGTNDSATIGSGLTGLGVVYGGTVDIKSIGTGDAKNLRYIEGAGISVTTTASTFSGSLTLVGSGAGTTHLISGSTNISGIVIGVNLSAGIANTNSLTLIQSGSVNNYGIYTSSSTLTAGGNMTLTQSGRASSGIHVSGSILTAGGDLTVSQTGIAIGIGSLYAIAISTSTLTAGGGMTVTQSGRSDDFGIMVNRSSLTATGGLSIVQSGTVGGGKDGIYLTSSIAVALTFTAGANSFVTFKTNNQNISLNAADNFAVTRGRVRIDLGTGAMFSRDSGFNIIATAANQYILKTLGLDVFYTGSTVVRSNSAKINVGSGSFTYLTEFASTSAVTLTDSTAANWSTGFTGNWTSVTGGWTAGGLTVLTTSTDASTVQGYGVKYGGTVDIQGISTGAVKDLNYIEGTGISVTGLTGSAFAGSLTLVASGAGTAVGNAISSLTRNQGIDIERNLSAVNNLTLIQSGTVSDYGIIVNTSVTLTAGGAMILTQSGSAGTNGIYAGSSTLTAGGNMTLTQSGSTGSMGIVVAYSTLKAGGDLSLNQNGTVGSGREGIILLSSAGSGVGNAQTFAAGTNNFVTFKTNNKKLSLNTADNFAVTSGRVRIDLGTGAMTSASGYTLKAIGLDVFFTGATAAGSNSATINVGGKGQFYNTVNMTTGGYTYNYDPSDLPSVTPPGGLTVTGNSTIGSAIFNDDEISIGRVSSTTNVPTALIGTKLTIFSNNNRFANSLSLIATNSSGTAFDVSGAIEVGANKTLSFSTNGGNLEIASVFTVRGGNRLIFDLGSGQVTGGNTITATGFTAYWYGSGAGNWGVLDLGVTGSFIIANRFFGDKALLATDIPTATAAPTGLTLSNSPTLYQGVVSGGKLTVNNVSATNTLPLLLESDSISVETAASSFRGDLVLNANSVKLGKNLTTAGTFTINAPSLTLTADITTSGGAVILNLGAAGVYDNLNGAAATNAGYKWTTTNQNLNLTAATMTVGTGTVFALGTGRLTTNFTIKGFGDHAYFTNATGVTSDATLRSALTRLGAAYTDNNAVYYSLADLNNGKGFGGAGFNGNSGDVTYSSGTATVLTNSNTVVRLYAMDSASLTRTVVAKSVSLFGTNSFRGNVTFDTSASNGDITLAGGNSSLSGGDLRLWLGSGKFLGGSVGFATTNGNVYYSGAFTNSTGTFEIGSGSFYSVGDQRLVTSATNLSSVPLANYGATATWVAGRTVGGITPYTADSGLGLTVSHNGNGSHDGIGIAYGGLLTINGVTGNSLNYIEAASISLTGSSSFSGVLTLNSNGGDFTNSGNLTNLGNLTIQTGGGNYYHAATVGGTSSFGGSVGSIVINLGSGVYNDHAASNLTRNILTATRNLSLISTGTPSVGSGTVIDIGTNWYGDGTGLISSTHNLLIDNTGVSNGATNLIPATIGGRAVGLDLARVTARKNFQVITTGSVAIDGVNNNAGSNLLVYNLERITGGSIEFRTNPSSFGDNLSLVTTAGGNISQTVGNLTMASGKELSLNASGNINLNGFYNSLGQLGTVTAGTTVTIWNDGDLSLNGNITAGGAITIYLIANTTFTGNGKLTLLKNITTSGGAVELKLGQGTYIDGGKTLTTSNNDLTLKLGGYSLTAATTSFAMGSGQFNSTITKSVSGASHSLVLADLLDGGKVSFTGVGKIASNRILIDKPIGITGLSYGYDLSVETRVGALAAYILFAGNNSFTGDLNLIARDGITQDLTSQITVTGTFSASTGGRGTLTLNVVNNSFGTIGTLTATGGVGTNSIDLYSTTAMTLTDTITADGTITLQSSGLMTLSKSGGLTLSSIGGITLTSVGMTLGSAVTSSGGAVTINTGTGSYYNLIGSDATVAGNLFTTTTQGLTITAASVTVGTGTVFDLGTSTSFTATISTSPTWGSGKNLYFTDTAVGLLPAAITGDSNKEYHSLADINGLNNVGLALGTGVNASKVTRQAALVALPTNAKVNFYNASYSAAVTIAAADTVKFWGTNSFTSLTLNTSGSVTQDAGSSLSVTGTFSAVVSPSGEIRLDQNGNRFTTLGRLTSNDGTNGVTIYSSGGFTISDDIRSAGIASLTSGGVISLSKAGGLSLFTGNRINLTATGLTLTSNVTTRGGDVTIDLGTGIYTDRGFTLTTSNNNLTLNLGEYAQTAPTTSFDLDTAQMNSIITKTGTVLLDSTSVGTKLLDTSKVSSTHANKIGTNSITSNDTITIQGLSYNGALRVETTASANIILNNTNRFDKNLDLVADGAITQSGGTIAFSDPNGKLLLTARGGSISLNQTGNNFKVIDAVSSNRTVEIWNNGNLKLYNNISAGGAITIDLTKNNATPVPNGSGNLTLLNNITTSGGPVTLNLGTGTYIDGGFLLTTTNQDLTLNLGKYSLTAVAVTVAPGVTAKSFYLGTGRFNSAITKTVSAPATSVTLNNNSVTGGDLLDPSNVTGTIARNSLTTTGTIEFGNLTYSTLLSVTAGGAITQTTGTTLAVSDVLSLATTIGSITLDQIGNRNIKLGTVSAGGAGQTVTIYNNGGMSLNGDISAGGAITIDLRQNAAVPTGSGNLTLLNNVNTRGGPVTINLGEGLYLDNSWTLKTNSKDLTLTVGSYSLNAANSFDMGSGLFSSTIKKTDTGTVNLVASDLFNGSKVSFTGVGKIALNLIQVNQPINLAVNNYEYDLEVKTTETSHNIVITAGNIFTKNLTLIAKGGISQGSGGSLKVDGTFSATATGASGINLDDLSNQFATIGTLSSSGIVTLKSSTAMTLSADISAAGSISLTSTAGLSLSGNVTTGGGAVTIDLGSGVYTNGATGFWLDTSNQNLTLIAGSISNTTASTIFKLKSGSGAAGNLTLTGTVVRSENRTDGTRYRGFASATTESAIVAGTITTYSFADSNGLASVTGSGTILNLPTAQLATGLVLGTKETIAVLGIETAGLTIDGSGNVSWAAQSLTTYNPATNISLATGKAMEIAGVTVATATSVTAFAPTTINFSGTNRFSSLSLTSTGNITQAAVSSIIVTGTFTATTTTGSIVLASTTNQITTLGRVSSAATSLLNLNLGTVTGVGHFITDDISSGGSIIITVGGNLSIGKAGGLRITAGAGRAIEMTVKNVTLTSNITTSGGAVSLLGARGMTYTDAGFKLTTDHQNLTISHSILTLSAATSFSEGSGEQVATFTASGIGVNTTGNVTISGNQARDAADVLIAGSTTELPLARIDFKTKIGGGFQTTGKLTVSGAITNSNFFRLSAGGGITVAGDLSTPDSTPLFLISSGGNIEINGKITVPELTLNTGQAITQSSSGLIDTPVLKASARNGIDLYQANKVTEVRSMTSTSGGIKFRNAINLAIKESMTANGGALMLRVNGTITSSVNLTGFDSVDIIATKLHWAASNLRLGTTGASGKTILIPTYNKQYLDSNVSGHIWITLTQPEGSDPDNIVNSAVTIVAALNPVVTSSSEGSNAGFNNFSGGKSGFGGSGLNGNQGALFTVSSSTSAEARPELKIGNISMPRLRASMNTTISSGENDESLAEDYYIPLAGNSALW